MEISYWSVLLLLLKLVIYVASAALAGNLVLRLLVRKNQASAENLAAFNVYLKRGALVCLSLALIASILQVPIEAGAMAESGFSGMTDAFMLEIVWQSVIGEQALVRIPAFLLAIVALITWGKYSPLFNALNILVTVGVLIVITYSFTFTGHSAEKNFWIKALLVLHVLAITCWVGSLLPLYKSCQLLAPTEVKRLMHQFGQLAIIIIVLLLASGITLILQYLDTVADLFSSSYGQLILLKLLLVSAMLILGAWHKLSLAPQIGRAHV